MAKQTIVVPVDGSPASERAVPFAVALATSGASILLVGVNEALTHQYVGDRLAEQIAKAEDEFLRRSLAPLKERFASADVHIDTEVRTGTAVDQVLNVLNERQAQYLVLSTHGRSGLNRWRYGSVASLLIREAAVPTLVVGPEVPNRADIRFQRILVPLDGSDLAEAALPTASELAKRFDGRVVLARGVPWAAQVYPSYDPVVLNKALEESAAVYLKEIAASNPATAETKVLRGYPVDALIDFVEGAGIDLVVMTSHGRAPLGRAVLGSVADRMLHSAAPVLLVRPS